MGIFIAGATGKLGQAVLKLLPNAIPLVRKKSGLKNELAVDFSNHAQLKKALTNCNTLIHLAGSTKFYDEKSLYEGNVLLTKNLLSALPKNAKAIFASSVSIYGKNLSGKASEKTKPNPDSAYARAKYEAEKLVMERKNSISLRIGPIYGPQYEDYSKFLRLIKKGRMMIFGNGKNHVPFVHVADVAKAIRNSIDAKSGVYVIAGEPEMQEKIYEIAAKALGVPAPKMKIQLRIALMLAALEEKIAFLSKRKPLITREHVNILGKDRVFDYSKAEKELKFRPRNLKKGIMEMVSKANL